jgi:LacI family transcriptional regulator
MLDAAGIPSVVIDRVPKSYVGAAVVLDNHAAGRIAAGHLISLGHRQLAYIGGPANVHIARERLGGFRAEAEAAGVDLPNTAFHHAENWHAASGYEAMRALLKRRRRFSAVFCAGDLLAIGAMHALAEVGLCIPDDISVMGLDDIDLAAYFTPPLTTISQSITSMATLGVELLLDELAGRARASNRIVIEPTLVVRASTASPTKPLHPPRDKDNL